MLRALFRGSHLSKHHGARQSSTEVKAEIEKFGNLANSWWSMDGELKALHSMNSLRIPFIQDGLINSGRLKSLEYPKPLKGVSIMDVGCGGGILSEPLARLGANVTGLDAAEEGIAVAKAHMERSLNINYVFSTIEKFAEDNPDASFDAIVASEVVEHVENPDLFLGTASKLLKPHGSLFLTTINRTRQSYLAGILAAEYILGLVPRGTHQWSRFITPEEIQVILSNHGVESRVIHGMCYNPVTETWNWTPGTCVNYAVHSVKAV